eukprot:Partr_v1_DN28927_c4_g1_i5_m25228 putative DlpA domain-containing protein
MSISDFASTDIADALVKLGVQSHLPGIQMLSPSRDGEARLHGVAYTVEMIAASEKPKQQIQGHYLDSIPEGAVIVIKTPQNSVNAVWGGLMTARAKSIGCKGAVIDGKCRDLLELRSMKFPVYARGTSCYGAGTFSKVSAVQIPIDIDGVIVNNGDHIVADIDGVVVVPVDLMAQVIEHCQKSSKIDELCMLDLITGRPIADTFKSHRN